MLTAFPQVIISFGASAFITLGLCITHYLIDFEHAANSVDRLFIHWLPLSGKRASDRSTRWAAILQTAVLTFSDIQVVTSIALLASGFSQLGCGLDVYHWQIIVDLAWFSSITHLTTLTCLRRYFQERPGLRLWRLVFMIVIATALGCAISSTGWSMQDADADFLPALCLYHPSRIRDVSDDPSPTGQYDGSYIAICLTFLGISYLSRIILLYPTTSKWMRKTFRKRPSSVIQHILVQLETKKLRAYFLSEKMLLHGICTMVLSVYCLLKAAADFYSSILWEVLLLWAFFEKLSLTYSLDDLAIRGPHLGYCPNLPGPHLALRIRPI